MVVLLYLLSLVWTLAGVFNVLAEGVGAGDMQFLTGAVYLTGAAIAERVDRVWK